MIIRPVVVEIVVGLLLFGGFLLIAGLGSIDVHGIVVARRRWRRRSLGAGAGTLSRRHCG